MTTKDDIEMLAAKFDDMAKNQPAKLPKWLLPVILSTIGVVGSITANYVFMTRPEAKTTHDEMVQVLGDRIAEQTKYIHPVQQEINKNFERRLTSQERLIDSIEHNVIIIGEKVGAGRKLRRVNDGE